MLDVFDFQLLQFQQPQSFCGNRFFLRIGYLLGLIQHQISISETLQHRECLRGEWMSRSQ